MSQCPSDFPIEPYTLHERRGSSGQKKNLFLPPEPSLSHAFNREIAGTAGQNDTRRIPSRVYVVPAIGILWDTLGHAGTKALFLRILWDTLGHAGTGMRFASRRRDLNDFESLDGHPNYGIIRSEFSLFNGFCEALPVTEKREIRIPQEVAVSIFIAALGLAGWMSKISFDTGAIKGDVSKAVEQNSEILSDHEFRLRDLEKEIR